MSKGLNIRPYNNKELLIFPPSIGDYLPKDHLAHVVDEAVEMIDLGPYFKKIPSVGNPSYHPALMIKILFYGYATKVYSSRKIEEKLHSDVAFIYLAGMQKPDFKTISEFRRKNLEELKNSFVDILQICHRLGMTKLGEIFIDSKVMKANASVSRNYNQKELQTELQEIEKAIQEYLEKANQIDDKEDKEYGPDKRGNELPEDIRDKTIRVKKMKQIVEQLKQAKEKLNQSNHKKINLTDNDAQLQKDKEQLTLGYRVHIAVDSKEQIIVATDVASKQSDQDELIPMIDKVIENVEKIKYSTETSSVKNANKRKSKIKVATDSGYSCAENLSKLATEKYRQKIDPYIQDQLCQAIQRGKKISPFDKNKFVYDKTNDEFICPAGNRLYYINSIKGKAGQMIKIYRCKDCKNCKYFGQCTSSAKGRSVAVSEYEHLIKQMRQKLSTPKGKILSKLRKIVVEPVLGNLSHNLGFKRFLLRGLQKVKGEFALMCIAHNILKITKFLKELGLTLKKAVGICNPSAVWDTS